MTLHGDLKDELACQEEARRVYRLGLASAMVALLARDDVDAVLLAAKEEAHRLLPLSAESKHTEVLLGKLASQYDQAVDDIRRHRQS